MNKKILSLKKLTYNLFKNGKKEMAGRSRGARLRETIEKILREGDEPCFVIDFSGMGSIDFSWADEVVAKMVSRLWGDEYGEKFFVLKGLTPSQEENIGVALERKKLAVLTTGPGGWRIIGSLNNYLVQTLNQVMNTSRLTLRELSEKEKIGMNTSGTRLLNLYRKRLVLRIEGVNDSNREATHRGRQYVYQSLLE
ncbi:MAG: STAS-like domain-containing protein [Desulfobacterales bacterium]|nr:STAS-like domain-containing protein [Desulfobacterales bacterium]